MLWSKLDPVEKDGQGRRRDYCANAHIVPRRVDCHEYTLIVSRAKLGDPIESHEYAHGLNASRKMLNHR
jgi:hypothetical protein